MQIYLAALLLLFFLNLLLTVAKVGFINARATRLMAMLDAQQEKGAKTALSLLQRRPELVLSLQILHILFRFLIAGLLILMYQLGRESMDPWMDLLVLVASAVVLSFLEQSLETRVLVEPEKWAARLAGFTRILLLVLSPVLLIPFFLTRLLPAETGKYFSVTEDELKILLEASEEEGFLEFDERRMINSVFRFRDTLARDIMVPRIDLLALNANTIVPDAVDAMLASGYSRVPVFEETIDKVIGVLYVKDLLRLSREGREVGALHDKIRPAYFVPETKKVGELLTEMQNRRIHIAVVVDEYGGVAGLVTLEDIVEELVGEIQDEYDQAEEQIYEEVAEGEYIFMGRIDLNDFNEITAAHFTKDEADTLSGLMYSRFGRIPKTGESIEVDDILLTVEQVVGRRIRKVRARMNQNEDAENNRPANAIE